MIPLLHRSASVLGMALALVAFVTMPVASQPPKKGPVVEELPAQAPAWVEGYRVRWPLRVVGDPAKQKNETVIAAVPTGGWLKADASDLIVQTAAGQSLPVQILSHDPAGDTIIQFKRNGNDVWYWAFGVSEKPLPQEKLEPAPREGMVAEFRNWAGDDLASWAKVRDGLKKSDNVIGNALAAEVVQNGNPLRPDQAQKFAASYRGFLNIQKEGVYRFYINADDAAFLFIDGFKVFERTGPNQAIHQLKQKVLQEKSGQIELKAGLHPIEVHHVVGSNVDARGICALAWQPPDEKGFPFVPRTAFASAMVAIPAAVEGASGSPAVAFAHGIDDSLSSSDVNLCLMRFEAQGDIKDEKSLVWDFGDGGKATGRSVVHVYMKDGDYPVTVKSPSGLPAFRRTVTVWASPPLVTSPLSLETVIKSLAADDWKKWEMDKLRQLFAFLLVCEQNQRERWELLEAVATHLLGQNNLEAEDRTELTITRMEALANLGKAREALKLGEQAEKSVTKGSGLQLGVRIAMASVHQYQLKEAAQASAMYKQMLADFKGVDHPNLRKAAIRWGDMLAESGDLAEAAKAYRLANTLGGERFEKTALMSAIERGAELRKVDKVLKDGNIHQARVILSQIEVNFPEQKLEGLYRFLRAEADRYGGHYEEAIHNYEILIRLQQWAGYRSRALAGIADGYHRMGKFDKALEWYGRLKQADPDYYEKAKLADRRLLIESRQARVQAAEQKGEKGALFFTGFTTGFEPGKPLPGQDLGNLTLTPGMGMQGGRVGFFNALLPSPLNSFHVHCPVHNLNPEGYYWVELWQRETLGNFNAGNAQQAYAWISPDTDKELHHPKGPPIYLDRTHGQWRKLGFKFKAPVAQDGMLVVLILNHVGVMEISGLTIRPITDPQNDSLISFLEGGTEAP